VSIGVPLTPAPEKTLAENSKFSRLAHLGALIRVTNHDIVHCTIRNVFMQSALSFVSAGPPNVECSIRGTFANARNDGRDSRCADHARRRHSCAANGVSKRWLRQSLLLEESWYLSGRQRELSEHPLIKPFLNIY
jgi:hypothetical protein